MTDSHYEAMQSPGPASRKGSFLPKRVDGPPSSNNEPNVWCMPYAAIAKGDAVASVTAELVKLGAANVKERVLDEPLALCHITWESGVAAAEAIEQIVAAHPKLQGQVSVDTIVVPGMMPAIGPATDPLPVDPTHLAPLWDAPDKADIAVVDTGMYEPAGRLAGRAEPVKEPVDIDPIGQGREIAYDGACHGGAVAGQVLSRTGRTVVVTSGLVPDETFMCDSEVFKALRRAHTKLGKAAAMNLSWGAYTTECHFPIATMAFVEAHREILFVAAAGNDMSDDPWYPAALAGHLDHVVSVGALDPATGGLAEFSNRGAWVTAYAPGVDVVTDYASGWWFRYPDGTKRWLWGAALWSGTSFAAPVALAAIVETWNGEGTLVKWWKQLRDQHGGPVRFA